MIFRFMQFHFINKAQNFSLENFDLLLQEITRKASGDTPEVLRITLHLICMIFSYFWRNEGSRKELFALKI